MRHRRRIVDRRVLGCDCAIGGAGIVALARAATTTPAPARAVAFAVFIAPAVILGAVLLWMRRRERPLDAQVSGIIDV